MRNVHRGDQNGTGVQLLRPVPGKREHAPQRYDKRPVVWLAALRIYFSLFLEATSLSPKKKKVYDIVKPSLFLKHIFQMECRAEMKNGCCRCGEIGGLNCVCRRRSVGKMCMYLQQLDASSSGC